jgi:hypothetical protein
MDSAEPWNSWASGCGARGPRAASRICRLTSMPRSVRTPCSPAAHRVAPSLHPTSSKERVPGGRCQSGSQSRLARTDLSAGIVEIVGRVIGSIRPRSCLGMVPEVGVTTKAWRGRAGQEKLSKMAVRQGFEPWEEFPPHRFSKPAPSASRPPHRDELLGPLGGPEPFTIAQGRGSPQHAPPRPSRFSGQASGWPGARREQPGGL